MTVDKIDRFRKELEDTEFIDDKTERFKQSAIEYLKLYCDFVEERGKKIIKQKGESNGQRH